MTIPLVNSSDSNFSNQDKRYTKFMSAQEWTWLILLFIATFLPRLVFIYAFPSHPTSDFFNIVNLASSFKSDWLARGNIYWHYFSAGLPLILSLLFKVFPFEPESISRWATAIVSGSTALAPFFLWKNTFSLRSRVIAGLLLALWPGQIIFSGIPAQDNWILPSTVALAALSVRIWVKGENGKSVWVALLFAITVAIRQEMLLVLLPLAIIAIVGSNKEKMARNLLSAMSIVTCIFGFLIFQRGMSTGHYSLSTEHFGVSIGGAYIPGAGLGWTSPVPYLEMVDPKAVAENNYEREAAELAWKEFTRRPKYHVIRITGSVLFNLLKADNTYLWWTLNGEGVLPDTYHEDAYLLLQNITPWINFPPVLIQVLFLSALFFSFIKRQLLVWISPILSVLLLKIGIHAFVVSQPRYYLVVIALQI